MPRRAGRRSRAPRAAREDRRPARSVPPSAPAPRAPPRAGPGRARRTPGAPRPVRLGRAGRVARAAGGVVGLVQQLPAARPDRPVPGLVRDPLADHVARRGGRLRAGEQADALHRRRTRDAEVGAQRRGEVDQAHGAVDPVAVRANARELHGQGHGDLLVVETEAVVAVAALEERLPVVGGDDDGPLLGAGETGEPAQQDVQRPVEVLDAAPVGELQQPARGRDVRADDRAAPFDADQVRDGAALHGVGGRLLVQQIHQVLAQHLDLHGRIGPVRVHVVHVEEAGPRVRRVAHPRDGGLAQVATRRVPARARRVEDLEALGEPQLLGDPGVRHEGGRAVARRAERLGEGLEAARKPPGAAGGSLLGAALQRAGGDLGQRADRDVVLRGIERREERRDRWKRPGRLGGRVVEPQALAREGVEGRRPELAPVDPEVVAPQGVGDHEHHVPGTRRRLHMELRARAGRRQIRLQAVAGGTGEQRREQQDSGEPGPHRPPEGSPENARNPGHVALRAQRGAGQSKRNHRRGARSSRAPPGRFASSTEKTRSRRSLGPSGCRSAKRRQ
jgi:hypothetical protein